MLLSRYRMDAGDKLAGFYFSENDNFLMYIINMVFFFVLFGKLV